MKYQTLTQYVSYYTVVINLNAGVVAGTDNSTNPIQFQNGCDYGGYGCLLLPGQPCIRTLDCGQYYYVTQGQGGTAYLNQNVQIYLAFQGTATSSGGNVPLRSATTLPANFRQYALTTYFGALTNLFVPTTN
jgi:hypothetical protein